MHAMLLGKSADIQTKPLAWIELPAPEPGSGEVRLRVQVCGVCRTDLHIVEGELPPAKRPVIPGHEVVGYVDRVGRNVRTIKEGDRVGIAWLQRVCGAESPPEKLHGAIMFAPAGELVPPALRALEKGGTLAVAGIYLSPIPSLDYNRELFGERVLRSVTANTKQDGIDLLQEAAAIPIRPHTERFDLQDANKALQALKGGTIQGAAILQVASS